MTFAGGNARRLQSSMEELVRAHRLEEFVKKHDHLPPITHPDSDLVMWTLRKQRLDEKERSSGENFYICFLLQKLVDSRGNRVWEWVDANDQFEACYSSLIEYIDVNDQYPSSGGGSLKDWMVEQRTMRYSLSDTQRKKMEALPGWRWTGRFPGRAAIKIARDAGTFPPQDRPAKRDREEEDVPTTTSKPRLSHDE